MAEIRRAYAVGDTVISTRILHGLPVEPPGVRLEIPLACAGTVVDVRPYDYPKPYVVMFETDDGIVEIDVAEHQIGRVQSSAPAPVPVPSDMPPLNVGVPHRHINRRALHVPTAQYPHYDCKFFHRVHFILLCFAYGLVLTEYTVSVVVLTMVILGSSYAHHLKTEGGWSWCPRIFRHIEPEANEKFVSDPHYVEIGRILDVVFMLVVSVFLAYHVGAEYGSIHSSALVHGFLSVAAITAWLAQFIAHEKAVRVFPDYDN